ncbi:MAG: RNA 2',3'-cyclic phosphodiesterase [Methanonatronarchaeales archaeon]|nr:RNA 2',3'-cyclic phosphodiesterase [Methanonatronarchaeales archaeon]
MRCFVSVDLPPELSGRIREFQEELVSTGADLNAVDPMTVHLTLKFLGEVDEGTASEVEEGLKRAAENVEAFGAEFRGTGVFPSRDYVRVVWVGAEGEGFVELASRVEDEMAGLGFEREGRKFVPHATVARMRSGRARDRVLDVVDSYGGRFGEMEVEELRLKRSVLTPEGPEYSDLAVVPL